MAVKHQALIESQIRKARYKQGSACDHSVGYYIQKVLTGLGTAENNINAGMCPFN